MLFNSLEFGIFFAIVYGLYLILPHKWQNRMLLAASYVFYGSWDWRFLSLIFISTVIDYYCGAKIFEAKDKNNRKFYVTLSIITNLLILGTFKYFNFFAENLQTLFNNFGLTVDPRLFNIILPVGISFYTFQSMSYAIDIYRKEMKPSKNFYDFALFVAFFPQLVAGPIERAKRLLGQITGERKVTWKQFTDGSWLILWGLFKKVVIADNLAFVVDNVFQSTTTPSGLMCLFGIYAFAFQIYCDFSGYSNIARGLSKLMGIELMRNFNHPYWAKNPQEFWKRWHISLSSWLRDYLYIPLGGNKNGRYATYRNLFITMFLGGLWHGAAWTFIWWGIYQWALLAGHRFLFIENKIKIFPNKISGALNRIGMFHLVCLGWLIFRANSMNQVGLFLKQIFFNFYVDFQSAQIIFYFLFFAGILTAFEILMKHTDNPKLIPGWNFIIGPVVACGMVLAIFILGPPQGNAFLYFQF